MDIPAPLIDAIGRFIQTVGFPVAVSLFVLVRLNGKLEKLVQAIERNTRILERHMGLNPDKDGD